MKSTTTFKSVTPRRKPGRLVAKVRSGCAHPSGPAVLESSLRLMKEAGLKKTAPRSKLLQLMIDFERPFSADDLSRRAKTKVRTIFDLVTIYRNLATFAEIGVLSRVDLGDGVVRYEVRDPSGHHHHHVVCTACRKIEPLDLCARGSPIETPLAIEQKRLASLGYQNVSHRLEFSGLCPSCSLGSRRS